ncbi:MAG: chemotaxis protein CheA, partial [Planctomycetales bacterium]|nr:chemotaxis protein CheA [Planctomycetales bacterium]
SDPQLPALLAAIDAVVNGKTPESLPERASAHEEGRPGPASAKPSPTPATTGNKSLRPDTQIKESIKVDRDRLDKLINVIGELVIGQAMVEEEVAAWQASVGHESLAMSQLNKTVRDLQELSLSLRMVPVGSAFHKMARIVRDLGRKLNKQIRFETEGDETELDKTVVDQIGDPLLHMVRNAADHGIESPEERVAAGKPPEGRVALRAYHQGGNIYIEIEDDGRGLNREALLAKAIERGIVSETDVLSDGQIDNLIFAPGFSTAKQVTDVSGRGVGMDVVRRNVEALQGSVSVSSRFGKGSTVVIRLPLTLAILDGLSIRVGQEVYIVPILSVVESFRPQHSDVKHIGGRGEVVMVRGEVVPLLRLGRLLHIPTNNDDQHPANDLVVIVEDRGRKYALLVDELLGQSQVVIKNLETNYRKVDGVAGATILGDGRIAMILDVFGLVCLIGNGQPSGHRDVYMESMAATDDDVEVFESL